MTLFSKGRIVGLSLLSISTAVAVMVATLGTASARPIDDSPKYSPPAAPIYSWSSKKSITGGTNGAPTRSQTDDYFILNITVKAAKPTNAFPRPSDKKSAVFYPYYVLAKAECTVNPKYRTPKERTFPKSKIWVGDQKNLSLVLDETAASHRTKSTAEAFGWMDNGSAGHLLNVRAMCWMYSDNTRMSFGKRVEVKTTVQVSNTSKNFNS